MSSERAAVLALLREKKWTIGFAESCTGGKLSALLVEEPGVSDVFQGSIVSYANSLKSELLGVQQKSLETWGAVSEEVALEMAKGARVRLKVDVAVAVTGIAGPSGGSDRKPVGLVCFAAVGPNLETTTSVRFTGDRAGIQAQAAETALRVLREAMETGT